MIPPSALCALGKQQQCRRTMGKSRTFRVTAWRKTAAQTKHITQCRSVGPNQYLPIPCNCLIQSNASLLYFQNPSCSETLFEVYSLYRCRIEEQRQLVITFVLRYFHLLFLSLNWSAEGKQQGPFPALRKILLATHRTRSSPRISLRRFHPVGTLTSIRGSWHCFTQGVSTSVVGIQFSTCRRSQMNCQIESRFQI